MRTPSLHVLFCLTGLAAGAAPTAATPAQEPAPTDSAAPAPAPDTGRLIPCRAVALDSTKSYAVYLPPGYDPGRRWPALILMDPRGRALVPLERFRPAAAALGYVILSSYDTSSDEPTSAEDTRTGVEALLNDAVADLALDARRFYLVGFSGTARLAWTMALLNPDYFPAVVGFGAGLHPRVAMAVAASGRKGPAFFGGAGTGDFNYSEMWETDARLDGLGIPHAMAYFPAGHAWAPAEVAGAAVAWLELRAQADGLAPVDSAWVRGRFDAALEDARALEVEGRLHDAALAFRRLLATFGDFERLLGSRLEEPRAAEDRLRRSRDVRRAAERLDRWLAWEGERRAAFRRAETALREPGAVPALDRLEELAELEAIRRHADSRDTLAAQAAVRAAASLVGLASFYLPRELLARGDTARALRALELAHRAAPSAGIVCLRFHALIGPAAAGSSPLGAACAPDPVRDRGSPPPAAGPGRGAPPP